MFFFFLRVCECVQIWGILMLIQFFDHWPTCIRYPTEYFFPFFGSYCNSWLFALYSFNVSRKKRHYWNNKKYAIHCKGVVGKYESHHCLHWNPFEIVTFSIEFGCLLCYVGLPRPVVWERRAFKWCVYGRFYYKCIVFSVKLNKKHSAIHLLFPQFILGTEMRASNSTE